MNVSPEVKSTLEALYKDINIHSDLDWEVTIAGNGTNASEAINVMDGIFNALGLPKPQYTSEERKAVIENAGEDPEDYD